MMLSAEASSLCSDELLIEEVRQRPRLYDQRLKSYRDKQLQNDAWLEIASALKQSVAELQHRWNCLRQKFLRLRKTYAKPGSGAADVAKSWLLMPHLMFLADAIQHRSLARQDASAALSLGHSVESASDSTSSVGGSCRTFYIDSTQDASIPDEVLQVLSTPDASSNPSSEVDSRPVTIAPGTSSVCSDKSYAPPNNSNKPAKRKQKDLDDLMNTTLAANRQRLNELTTAVTSVDEDEHFLLSLKGPLVKVDGRKKEHIKLQIYSLLVEAAYPPHAAEP
nr:transcription factor Adf-1-like [Dermacentor andersoni]